MIRFLSCFAVAVLFLCSASGPDGLVHAQILVGNLDEYDKAYGSLAFHDYAQAFTTGDHANGYALTSVEIDLFIITAPPSRYSVSLWTDNGADEPGSMVGSLSPPAQLYELGHDAFAADGIDLEANTTYFVVVDGSEDDRASLKLKSSNAENPGAASGWSIGDESLYRWQSLDSGGWQIRDDPMQIRINGSARSTPIPPTPTPPTTPTTPATPAAISDPPQYLRATVGDSEVTLTWDAPYYNGGSEITGYEYRYKESTRIFGFNALQAWEDIPGEASARSYTVMGLTNGLEYTFELRAENAHGDGRAATTNVALPTTVVNTESEELPVEVVLLGNYPNPFNPETTIRYALPQAGKVRLVVYDLLGQEVAVLVDGSRPAGHHTVRFDGGGLPSGSYVYRLQIGEEVMARTMTLVK